MSDTIEIQGAATIGAEECAKWFAQANSEQQAEFFRRVAGIASTSYEVPPVFQWHHIGHELATHRHHYMLAIDMLTEIASYVAENPDED